MSAANGIFYQNCGMGTYFSKGRQSCWEKEIDTFLKTRETDLFSKVYLNHWP
jgi:hypothetical protein